MTIVRPKKLARDSGGEHLVQDGKDLLRRGVVDFAQPLHKAHFVDGADLVQDDLTFFSLESDGTRVGYSRRCVVIGAMMTVPMWRFISSGEMIRQGRVLRISRPSVGFRRTR